MEDKKDLIKFIKRSLSSNEPNRLKTIKNGLNHIGGKWVNFLDNNCIIRHGYVVSAIIDTQYNYYYVLLDVDKLLTYIPFNQGIEVNYHVMQSEVYKDYVAYIEEHIGDIKEYIERDLPNDSLYFAPLYLGSKKTFLSYKNMILSANNNEAVARLKEISIPSTQDLNQYLMGLKNKRDFIKRERAKIMEETKTEYVDESTVIEEDIQVDTNKIKELEDKLEIAQLKYLNLMADFDNYKKRTLKEKEEIKKNANEDLLINIIYLVDDLEYGMKMSPSEGLTLIRNKFLKFLRDNNVTPMKTDGAEYDSNLHEAVSLAEKGKSGYIIETIEKGYYLNDKVIRYAKVIVGV